MKKNTPEATFEALKHIPLDLNRINYHAIEVDNVCPGDYPDFCDAYIVYAEYTDGTAFDEDELEQLNEHSDIVYEAAWLSSY